QAAGADEADLAGARVPRAVGVLVGHAGVALARDPEPDRVVARLLAQVRDARALGGLAVAEGPVGVHALVDESRGVDHALHLEGHDADGEIVADLVAAREARGRAVQRVDARDVVLLQVHEGLAGRAGPVHDRAAELGVVAGLELVAAVAHAVEVPDLVGGHGPHVRAVVARAGD